MSLNCNDKINNMRRVYIFEILKNIKIAVRENTPVMTFTDFIIRILDIESEHLYYYTDGKSRHYTISYSKAHGAIGSLALH